MNSNKELLDWAVENIKDWDDKFTHLYSDSSGYFYGVAGFTKEYFDDKAYMWEVGEYYNGWTWILRTYDDINNEPPVQVITKQEWLDAKKEKEDMSNTYNLKDLKTGQRVTLEDGTIGVVYTNCDLGIAFDIPEEYSICFKPSNEDCFSSLQFFLQDNGSIIKVESPNSVGDFMKIEVSVEYTTIWERPTKETPEQAKQRELQQQYEATKKQLEELGKQLGIE